MPVHASQLYAKNVANLLELLAPDGQLDPEQDDDIVPLIGARRRNRLDEALGALDVKLTDAHLAALETAFPPGVAAGGRVSSLYTVVMNVGLVLAGGSSRSR